MAQQNFQEHDLNLRFRLQDNIRGDVVERVLNDRGWCRVEVEVENSSDTGLVDECATKHVINNGLPQSVSHSRINLGSPRSRRLTLQHGSKLEGDHTYQLFFKRGRFTKSEFETATRKSLSDTRRLRINHFQETSLITHKGKLLRLMKKLKAQYGALFNFAPEGYILPSEYTKFTKAYSKYRDQGTCWIVKPQGLSQGQGITLVRDLGELKYDSESVIQRYIDKPLLIGGYKFDLRVYVLVESAHPLKIWVFDDGIVRFSTKKYQHPSEEGFRREDLLGHLTNASIHKNSQTYAADKDVIGKGSKWDFQQLKKWFAEQGRPLAFHVVWERLKTVVRLTCLPLLSVLPVSHVPFEVLGFDVMIDEKLKPWLIETNAAPSLTVDSAVDRRVKPKLINDLMEVLDFRCMVQRADAYEAREAERHAVFSQVSLNSAVPNRTTTKSSSNANANKAVCRSNRAKKSNNEKKSLVQINEVSSVKVNTSNDTAPITIPGQVLSPTTVGARVEAQNPIKKSVRRITNLREAGSRRAKSNQGRGRTVTQSDGLNSLRQKNSHSGRTRTMRSHSKRRLGSTSKKDSNGTHDAVLQAQMDADWLQERKVAQGFQLVFPFSAASLAVSKSTSEICGKPVELDAALKQTLSMVKAYHKGCTQRARDHFSMLETKVQDDKQTSLLNRGEVQNVVKSADSPTLSNSGPNSICNPRAGNRFAHDDMAAQKPGCSDADEDILVAVIEQLISQALQTVDEDRS